MKQKHSHINVWAMQVGILPLPTADFYLHISHVYSM